MKKKLLGLLLGLFITMPAFASIGVSPTNIAINADKAKTSYVTATINVQGDVNKPVRFKIYPGYFKIGDDSQAILLEKSNEPYDISKKVRFVPSEFTVAPGKTQKVRVNITNLNTLPNGESRAMLYIEDVNAKEYAVPNTQGIGAQLIVKTRVGVPIYVDKKALKIGEIEHFNMVQEKDGYYTDLKILSKGNSRINCTEKIQFIKDKKLVYEVSLLDAVVGNGTSTTIKEKIDTSKIKEAGEYTIRAVVSYTDTDGRKKLLKQDTILKIQGEM